MTIKTGGCPVTPSMPGLHTRIFLLVMGVLLNGCNTPLAPVLAPEPADYPVTQYVHWLGEAGPVDLAVERRRLELLIPGATLIDRIQMALMLGMNNDLKSNTAALALVTELPVPPADDELVQDYVLIAEMWREMLALRLRPPEVREILIDNDVVNRNLEERNLFLERENTLLLQQRLLLKKRNKFLEAQVEELTTMERQLMEREQSQASQ